MGGLLSSKQTSFQNDTPAKNIETKFTHFDEFIKKEINSHDIVIFSQTNCSYCKLAKSVLDNKRQAYHAIELDVNSQCPQEDCKSLTRSLMLLTHMKTVPQIFVQGKLIGGFSELDTLIKTNRFETLLKK